VEQLDDFAGWVKAKRVELASVQAVFSRGKLNNGRSPDEEMAAYLEGKFASCAKCAGDGSEWRFCRPRFLGRENPACGSIRNWAGFRPKCGRN
jgi:hypothetical protein